MSWGSQFKVLHSCTWWSESSEKHLWILHLKKELMQRCGDDLANCFGLLIIGVQTSGGTVDVDVLADAYRKRNRSPNPDTKIVLLFTASSTPTYMEGQDSPFQSGFRWARFGLPCLSEGIYPKPH